MDTSKNLTVSGEAAYAAVESLFTLSEKANKASALGYGYEERALMSEWWAGHRMLLALFGRETWDAMCAEYHVRHPEYTTAILAEGRSA